MKNRSQSNTLPQLGELELKLLRLLWEQPGQDVKSLWQKLPEADRISVNTVQSTLERLYRKQWLNREKKGRAYVYAPGVTRGEFLGRLLSGVVARVHTGSLSPILSGFVDFADRLSDESLDELERLIEQRRQKRQEDS